MSQKKAKVKNLRNILATPFNIQWSESSPESLALLQKSLEELLPLAKLEKKVLKVRSKDEMKEKVISDSLEKKPTNIFRTYLALGFQSVIRGLEKDEISCVMMSSDISPPMIPRVICSHCNARDVPLMTVPQLKTISKSTLGFPTMVIGVKTISDAVDNPFLQIYDIVSQNRSVLEVPFGAKQNVDLAPSKKTKCESKIERTFEPSGKSTDFYLFRDDKNTRVFRPAVEVNCQAKSQVQDTVKHGMDGDFISFSKSENKSSEHFVSVSKIEEKNDSEDEVSECDSLDEDNIFFVDNKPDEMLVETDLLNNKTADFQIQASTERIGEKLKNKDIKKSNKKGKTMSDRYFSGEAKQNENMKKNKKESKVKVNVTTKNKNKTNSSSIKFNPLTIKTAISNPKKFRRRNKQL